MYLQQCQKLMKPNKDICADDIVIIKDENLPRNKWQLACISAINQSTDGRVRTVQLTLPDNLLDSKGKRVGKKRFPGASSSEVGPAYVKGRSRC